MQNFKHLYGPVPSRRLGRSLGIDLVPFKFCSYDCIYCQLGRTTLKTIERKPYVSSESILEEISIKIKEIQKPDFITLSGSGEPTLNSETGHLIKSIKKITDVPVAVLTNGSLLWMEDVREDLMEADLVIPSLDAGYKSAFQYINRPHDGISFRTMVEGIQKFTERFKGDVWLEIMILEGLTSAEYEIRMLAELAKLIKPKKVQLNTVIRPPCEKFAIPVSFNSMMSYKSFFSMPTEIITREPEKFPEASDASSASEGDIMDMLRRRPCTAADISDGLGIHVTEVIKLMEPMIEKARVGIMTSDTKNYYIPGERCLAQGDMDMKENG